MALYEIKNNKAKKILPIKVGLEKDIHKLFEANLDEILNINFLASEYSTGFGGRIDTLGIDNNGAPTIIEYKRNQNENVINQGLSYLRWLLDHKADFEILVQKKAKRIEIDWESPRVICVAESYNKFDLDTADLLPIKIELLRYKLYDNNVLLVEPEMHQKVRIATSKIFQKSKKENEGIRKTKVYAIDTHLKIASKGTITLFKALKEKIMSLDEAIIEEPKAKYIAYKLTTNFTDVVIQKNSLKLFINILTGKLDDPFGLARDLTKPKRVGHWGNGDYEVRLDSEKELGKVFELVKQSYDYNR